MKPDMSTSPKPSSAVPMLLLLPGLDGTGKIFEPMLDHITEAFETQVVCYPADRVMSFQEHVDFARKQMPRKRPFVLLAESFSGPIGLQLIAEPPANLVGVLFVATFARHPSPFLLDVGRYLPPRFLLTLFSKTPIGKFFGLSGASSAAVAIFQNALKTVKLDVLANRLKILSELPPPPETAFSGPCLYLQASADRLVPSRAVAPLQQLLPQLQIEQIRGPHVILLAHPESGAQLISNFITSLTDER